MRDSNLNVRQTSIEIPPMCTISIIVPIYNSETCLRRCVDSILAQTFCDFELLLINDGSTDSSGAICDEYAVMDARVKVFHKSNGGVSSARNLGIEKSTGKWVTFCDSDDYVYKYWLDNFELEISDCYDIVCQGMESDKDIFPNQPNPKESGFSFNGVTHEFVNKLNESGLFGYLFIKCFKRSIIEDYRVRFDDNIKFQEDEVFLCEYLIHARISKSVERKGYYYFAPEWGKYGGINIDHIVYRTRKSLNALHVIMPNGYDSPILQSKLNSLILYLVEAYNQYRNLQYLREIRFLFKKGFHTQKIPKTVEKIIEIDNTYIVLFVLLFVYKIMCLLSHKKRVYI